jgi:hypothetical protein
VKPTTEMPEGWRMRPEERNRRPKTFTAAELMAEELPEARWIVPDVLPEGVTFLAGKPKVGKSWMVLGIGLAVATGVVALSNAYRLILDCRAMRPSPRQSRRDNAIVRNMKGVGHVNRRSN